MMLKNKNAVIYGGGGAIGGAVAMAFAREGASVFLAGRSLDTLEAVAKKIAEEGGIAETAQADALSKESVEAHLSEIIKKAGRVDISFNAISINDTQGSALVEMQQDQFMSPVVNAMNTHFITATAAARYMTKQGSGVILAVTAKCCP
ncbi:MAG: SDR family NAD(P)-dependent oxidoreductase [Bacteroidota bacterium]